MRHFYDGQIRRYITQIVRLMSNFTYKDGKNQLVTVPVMYGDMTRQVGNIIKDNSENKIPSTPRMSVYVTGLEMDTARLADSSYVNKKNIRERAYDEDGNEYLNTEGRNYTVERLMPTPYKLSVNVDIWSTNTDQKLQIMEQILMLFNPSLEIQTTDNYLDWTSLSVVNLENVNWSSRSIPTGTESEIDISTLGFTTPIYISPPVKVKRLGVITDIITGIFDGASIDLDESVTEANIRTGLVVTDTGEIERITRTKDLSRVDVSTVAATAYGNHELLVLNTSLKLIYRGVVGGTTWKQFLLAFPQEYEEGITQIRLRRSDRDIDIVGTIAINPADETEAIVNWDFDTLPTDTPIAGPNGTRSNIDYIIDPTKTNPTDFKSGNPRILLLGPIGDPDNTDGADAWKNSSNSDFVADANDIVEWDGSQWHIVFDASENNDFVYTTNLNTGVQYKYDTGEWILSFEGEYPNGSWRLNF